MRSQWLSRRRMALVAVVLALLLGGAALLSPSLVLSYPVPSAVLGAEWQCSSVAFLTTCSRVEMVTPVARRLSNDRQGRPGA